MKIDYELKSAFKELKTLDERNEDELRIKSYPYKTKGKCSNRNFQNAMKSYVDYRNRWKECGKSYKYTSFPTNVDIEASSLCNLRCKMCNWGFHPKESPAPGTLKKFQKFKKNSGNMDMQLYTNIIDEVVKEGGCAVKLNWRGEPLVNKNIADMIKYAKESGILEVLINTNGSLLNEELSSKIIAAGLDIIIFSFDGMTKGTYESIRRGAEFTVTLSNILTFIRLRDANKRSTGSPKPLIRVQMVVMDVNKHEVELFKKFFSPLVEFVTTQEYTNRGEQDNRLAEDLIPDGRKTCPQIWQRMIVAWDGKVGICCRDWDLYHHIGNLDYPNTTIKNLWNGTDINKIRDLHRAEKLEMLDACKSCTYKESFKWRRHGS